MSPRREPLTHEQSRRQEASGEMLFQKAQKNDRIDLSQFSKDDQQALYSWYTKNADTLSHDDRMQFLEQCIAHRIIDDKKLLAHIEPLTKTLAEPEDDDAYNDAKLSLRTIGEYLAFMKDPAYIESLWECWDEISYETQRDLIHYCTREKPELAILVAPFTDMSRLYVFTSKTGGEKVVYKSRIINARDIYYQNRRKVEEEKKFIDIHFEHFEDAKPYIESLVSYCEKHRGKLYSDSPAVENLRAIHKIFLFPYLKRIEALNIGIIAEEKKHYWEEKDEKEKTAIQQFLEKGNISYCNFKNFLTKKEREEIEHLRKEFIRHNPKMAERLTADTSGFLAIDENLSPEQHRRTLMRIIDAGHIRAAHTILDSFQDYKHHLSEKEQQEFLLECWEKNYPVFAVIDTLGLSKEAVADLFKKAAQKSYGCFPLNTLYTNADIEALLTFNTSTQQGPDLEKIMVTWLTKNLQSGGQTDGLKRLIQYNTDAILPLFSQENQHKIIQAIDKDFPGLWIKNIPFALDHSKTPFHTLLNSMDEYEFLEHYHLIIYHAHQLQKKDIKTGVTIQDIRQCARSIILSSSWAFFQYPKIVKENLTDAEQKEYIESRLLPPAQSRFFLQLLGSSFKDTYKERCKKIIENDQNLLDTCMHSYSGRTFAIELLGAKKSLAYALEKIESDSEIIEDMLNREEVYSLLFQSQSSIKTFMKKIEETESYHLLLDTFKKIRSLISSIDYAKKNKTKPRNETISKERLKELEEIFLKAISDACDKHQFLIFHEDIREIPELNVQKRMTQHADAYFSDHPEELLDLAYRGNKKFIYEELLGGGLFLLLVLRHKQTLALSKDLSPEKLAFFDEDVREKCMAINPSLRVFSKEKLDEDFYTSIISEIRHSVFFPVYEKRLREIAAGEFELYGKQDTPKDVRIPDEFKKITKRIAILEQNSCAREHADFFLRLPEKQRERILHTLEFLSVHNLADNILFDPKNESADELQSRMHTKVLGLFERAFDITLTDASLKKMENFSLEGLGALIIYYKKTCSEHPKMKTLLQECISHVLDGTYASWKLPNIEALPELQDDKLLPKNLSQKQYELWKKEDTLDFEDVIQYDIASIHFGIREVLDQAIVDGHIDKDLFSLSMNELQKQYAELTQPLQELMDRQKEFQVYGRERKGEISQEQQEEYNSLKQDITQYMAEHKTEMARMKALRYLHELRKISAHDLEEKILTTEEKKRVPFSEIFKTMHIAFQEEFPYFAGDIARIQSVLSEGRQNIFSGERVSKTQLFITDRIDFETYARIGEKPVESCQHYNGKGYNKGLLSYLVDPNLKIVQVYDARENIIARAILRLVSTHDGNPAIFSERVYSVNSHPKINEAIENYVRQKANIMGIPYAITGKSSISESIFQTGSRSPFVYTDAGGGLVSNGVFEIVQSATSHFKFKGPEEVDNPGDMK